MAEEWNKSKIKQRKGIIDEFLDLAQEMHEISWIWAFKSKLPKIHISTHWDRLIISRKLNSNYICGSDELNTLQKELVKSIHTYDKFDWDNYHRKTASKFIEILNLSVRSAHNKIQKLPKMQNLVQEIEIIEKPSPIIMNVDSKIKKKAKNISEISWSSIKFSEEDESEHIQNDNLKLNSSFKFYNRYSSIR